MTTQEFLKEFIPASEKKDMAILHELRREIFRQTAQCVMTGSYITESGQKVTFPDPSPMMSQSKLYTSVKSATAPELPSPTIVEVKSSDSLLAGKDLLDEGYNPAVLNFANRETAGGGVLNGDGAQEENIFRRSNLFLSLYQFHPDGISFGVLPKAEHYPMDRNTGGAYSPDVTVFRGAEADGYPLLEKPYRLGIVSVAAMNHPALRNEYRLAIDLVEPTREKMRTIFRIALNHGYDAIVLGAWGCGAFKNPPQHIAKLFHQVMVEDEFRNRFKKIVFAVFERKDRADGNLIPFLEEFATPKDIPCTTSGKSSQEERFNRFKGMFWGLVIGDCLGSPIQFSKKDDHPHITEMVPCPIFNTPPGYWTDDSAMAFCVAESIVRLKKYNLKDIGKNFVCWLEKGFCSSLDHAFDVGNATYQAIEEGSIKNGSLKNGEEDSQGNGSIMRFAPSYILNYGAKDDKILFEISDLTHDSCRVRETVSLMARICDEHMLGQRTKVKSLYNTRAEVNNSGWAVSTLQAALWAFETTTTFEDGMIAAVNLGGDADTIGAVYGQIAGAYYGFDAIPSRWIDAVKNNKINMEKKDQEKAFKKYELVNTLIENLIRWKEQQ